MHFRFVEIGFHRQSIATKCKQKWLRAVNGDDISCSDTSVLNTFAFAPQQKLRYFLKTEYFRKPVTRCQLPNIHIITHIEKKLFLITISILVFIYCSHFAHKSFDRLTLQPYELTLRFVGIEHKVKVHLKISIHLCVDMLLFEPYTDYDSDIGGQMKRYWIDYYYDFGCDFFLCKENDEAYRNVLLHRSQWYEPAEPVCMCECS